PNRLAGRPEHTEGDALQQRWHDALVCRAGLRDNSIEEKNATKLPAIVKSRFRNARLKHRKKTRKKIETHCEQEGERVLASRQNEIYCDGDQIQQGNLGAKRIARPKASNGIDGHIHM